MKRKLPVLIAIILALAIALSACNYKIVRVDPETGNDPLPSHVQSPESEAQGKPAPESEVAVGPAPEAEAPVTPAPESEVAPAAPAEADPKLITMDEAIDIALKDAGFKETDVTGLHAELERDDGITIYDVDFYKDGKEYDYEIHAENGTVLKPVKQPAAATTSSSTGSSSGSSSSNKTSTGSSSSSSSSSASKNITKDEAISKALSHAGLKKSQVSRLKADLDKDDGRTVYDVEFETADWEYDYEINAKTGKVLKAEKDRND